jgi:hypothetical protein
VKKVTAGPGSSHYSESMSEYRLPSLAEFADAEHCVLEDLTHSSAALNDSASISSLPAREISDEFVIRDSLRGRKTSIRLYAEGWADIEIKCRGQSASHQRFNLSYLDPVPLTSRACPSLLLKITGALAALTGIAATGVMLDLFQPYTLPATIVGGVATLAGLLIVFYRSCQRVVLRTRHGRADSIRLRAGLGTGYGRRWRLPRHVNAIATASGSSDEDTATYLRSEMREHYRLRNEGLLTDDECSASTGKILSEFDGPL